ncbi:MAG: 16S rRNA (guanine(527)-N(7))-methyltransferase RsmG [Rhodobacteraceae bacterium]|nr:16S rRNA (guanine(527)-N(7))-methyltransferase RsmG [Paracoccaceae bacterium]
MTEGEARCLIQKRVSRETFDRLEELAATLVKWQRAINLIAPGTLTRMWVRHFLDSAQVFSLRQTDHGHWLDIGSGGGFPGLICAILAAEAAPELRFTFLESDLRKGAFLRDAACRMDLGILVLTRRIEKTKAQGADIISARALATLPRLSALAAPHLAPEGICLFQKGRNHRHELDAARQEWHMKFTAFESETSPESAIYRIGGLSRA